jgi:hypothetical protein
VEKSSPVKPGGTMKKDYRIFFAIPFDHLTKNIYDDICEELRDKFGTHGIRLTTVIGNEQIGPSPDYSEILSFKAQNKDLHEQFYKEISAADIIIADLTNNNPNVHIELGIGLSLNKNILRVTGRAIKELGFDIQNLDIYNYSDKKDLMEKMTKYLDMFFKIKSLDFSSKYGILYKNISGPLAIPEVSALPTEVRYPYHKHITEYSFRDGAINLKFKFGRNDNLESWFGIYFRAEEIPYLSSYLFYIRKNGSIELAPYNSYNYKVIYKYQLNSLTQEFELLMEIENDELDVTINGEAFRFSNLKLQAEGRIILGVYECSVVVENIELINRDTIELYD